MGEPADKTVDEPEKSKAAPEGEPRRRMNRMALAIGLCMAAVIAGAVFFSLKFVEDERLRKLQEWQTILGIVADSRAASINEWVDQNFASLRELTENASLQLYMSELAMAEGSAAGSDEPAQASYLRNLLMATAERTGFKSPMATGEIAANVEKVGVAGLGITDADGKLVRTFKQRAVRGVNRAVWNLRRDPFREPRREAGPSFFEPRYLAMVSDTLAASRMIGMIQPVAPNTALTI